MKRGLHFCRPLCFVQLRGLEPLPKYMDMNLNHARMPIPPQLHMKARDGDRTRDPHLGKVVLHR